MSYRDGVDALGDGFDASQITSMIPMMSMFSQGKGGAGSGTPATTAGKPAEDAATAIRRAIEEERARAAAEKAAASVRTTNILLVGVLGALGVGAIVMMTRNVKRRMS